MKARIVAAGVVPLLMCITACARSQSRGDPAAEVRAVWNAQVEAWNRGDLDGFMIGYWNSPDLVFFSNKTETRGWQQTLDRYRSEGWRIVHDHSSS